MSTTIYATDIVLVSSGTIYWGNSTTEGSWKKVRVENDVIFYRYESGVWIEKERIMALDNVYKSIMTGDEIFSVQYSSQRQRICILDAGGVERNFNPSGSFPDGFEMLIINNGNENIIFDSAGIAEVVPSNSVLSFFYNGSIWTW